MKNFPVFQIGKKCSSYQKTGNFEDFSGSSNLKKVLLPPKTYFYLAFTQIVSQKSIGKPKGNELNPQNFAPAAS